MHRKKDVQIGWSANKSKQESSWDPIVIAADDWASPPMAWPPLDLDAATALTGPAGVASAESWIFLTVKWALKCYKFFSPVFPNWIW